MTWAVLSGCYKPRAVTPMDMLRLPLPTKDEVVLVDNLALSVSDYLSIKNQLKNPSAETALWVGTSMLALRSHLSSQGKSISAQTAYDLARYAIGDLSESMATACLSEYYASSHYPAPEQVKKELEAISKKAMVRHNPMPLSQLN